MIRRRGPAPRHRYHFPVVNLTDIARPLELGRATFRPTGWLAALYGTTDGTPASDTQLNVRKQFEADARELDSATVDAEAATVVEARAYVSDAVAVLRFFQRRSHRYVSLDRQTFGLPGEVGGTIEHHWRTTTSNEPAFGGWSVSGITGDWQFSSEQIDQLERDPVVTYLSGLLQRLESDLSEFEARILTGLRLLNSATAMAAPGVRIVLLASALEAMLGDDPMQDRVHRIAQRSAFLTCTLDDPTRHNPDWRCMYFGPLTFRGLRELIGRQQTRGGHGICSSYWWHHEIFDARNLVLHEAKLDFDHRLAATFAGRVDRVLADSVLWRTRTKGALPELDEAMRAAALPEPAT